MTETEWLAATHIYELTHCSKCRDDRKRRLLSAAATRRVLHHTDPRFEAVVEATEKFADGLITWKDLLAVRKSLRAARRELEGTATLEHQNYVASAVEALTAKEFMSFKMALEATKHAIGALARPDFMAGCDREAVEQIRIARDIFGNPFRPVAFDPSWRTSTAVAIAQQMYDSRDFGAMPILADALQDAGCDNDDILNHCRDANGVHVRGCWVVDLVLGKS